jgi:hypothetical protein
VCVYRTVHSHLHQDVLDRVPFLSKLSSSLSHDLMLTLFSKMRPETFPKDQFIITRHAPANRCVCKESERGRGGGGGGGRERERERWFISAYVCHMRKSVCINLYASM